MGWFEDAFLWPRLLTSSEGRDRMKEDIKYGRGVASVGSPLHGLTAGYKLHELMSPTVHNNDRIQNIRKDGFGSDHLKWAIDDQNHNLQDAFKENIPALVGWLGGAAAGVGEGGGVLGGASGGAEAGAVGGGGGAISAGDAAALEAANASAGMSGTSGVSSASNMGFASPGTNWGGILSNAAGSASSAAGLLNQAQPQQQQPVMTSAPPQQQRNPQAQQQRALELQRIQQL